MEWVVERDRTTGSQGGSWRDGWNGQGWTSVAREVGLLWERTALNHGDDVGVEDGTVALGKGFGPIFDGVDEFSRIFFKRGLVVFEVDNGINCECSETWGIQRNTCFYSVVNAIKVVVSGFVFEAVDDAAVNKDVDGFSAVN